MYITCIYLSYHCFWMVYCLYWVFVCVCCAAPDKLTSPPPFPGLGSYNYHITRQAYEKKVISLPHTPSSSQLADFFTKAQMSPQFRLLLSKLSVYDPP